MTTTTNLSKCILAQIGGYSQTWLTDFFYIKKLQDVPSCYNQHSLQKIFKKSVYLQRGLLIEQMLKSADITDKIVKFVVLIWLALTMTH